MEIVTRRCEDDEVDSGGGFVLDPVPVGARAPEERVVESVEAGTVRDRRALRVTRASVPTTSCWSREAVWIAAL